MRNFTVQKSDFHKVACVEEIPEGAGTIVIAVHGFTSSKESPTVRRLLNRLPAAGIGVVGIDLPGHGTEDSFAEELRLEACIDSLAAAEWYVNGMYPKAEICYFASSFGAYVTGLYISSRHHKGHKAFFRSAAVNMPPDMTCSRFSTRMCWDRIRSPWPTGLRTRSLILQWLPASRKSSISRKLFFPERDTPSVTTRKPRTGWWIWPSVCIRKNFRRNDFPGPR